MHSSSSARTWRSWRACRTFWRACRRAAAPPFVLVERLVEVPQLLGRPISVKLLEAWSVRVWVGAWPGRGIPMVWRRSRTLMTSGAAADGVIMMRKKSSFHWMRSSNDASRSSSSGAWRVRGMTSQAAAARRTRHRRRRRPDCSSPARRLRACPCPAPRAIAAFGVLSCGRARPRERASSSSANDEKLGGRELERTRRRVECREVVCGCRRRQGEPHLRALVCLLSMWENQ